MIILTSTSFNQRLKKKKHSNPISVSPIDYCRKGDIFWKDKANGNESCYSLFLTIYSMLGMRRGIEKVNGFKKYLNRQYV